MGFISLVGGEMKKLRLVFKSARVFDVGGLFEPRRYEGREGISSRILKTSRPWILRGKK
jgi:hypothetical protein